MLSMLSMPELQILATKGYLQVTKCKAEKIIVLN